MHLLYIVDSTHHPGSVAKGGLLIIFSAPRLLVTILLTGLPNAIVYNRYIASIKAIINHYFCSSESSDYISPPCNYTFPTGGYSDCLEITVINDYVVESNENLTVSIGAVFVDMIRVDIGDRVKSNVPQAVIQIIDNDCKYLIIRIYMSVR